MKKNIYFAIFLAMSFVIALTSCSQDLDYKKACHDKDFMKAYEIVDKLKEITSEAEIEFDKWNAKKYREEETEEHRSIYIEAKKKSDAAEKYVVLQEALYVLEENGESGLVRIAAIIKEHNADWLYDELKQMMKSIGNDNMMKKIEEMDPHSATLSLETPTVSGKFKEFFRVMETEARIENLVTLTGLSGETDERVPGLIVSLERIKKGGPKCDKQSFSIIIMDENGKTICTEKSLGNYQINNESGVIKVGFVIRNETYNMKKFAISSD